jgi:hypothetical protein
VVKISPEWVTGPEQGKSSGRIATFSLRTGMLYKYAPEEFKLKLLKFLNNIYRENCIPNKWRNAGITPIFKKGDRRGPQNYRGISILNTCYKIYSKILNMKLQNYSEVFMTEM